MNTSNEGVAPSEKETTASDDCPNKEQGEEPNYVSKKKPYTTPVLKIYGTIEKLTKTGGRTTRDGGGGRKRH